MDPIKYMIGKYESIKSKIETLPSIGEVDGLKKFNDPNNASFVDGLFCYLSGQMLNTHNSLNSIDYYGSFLGIQEQYKYNVTDDYEYISSSTYFNTKVNDLFNIKNDRSMDYTNYGSRKHNLKLNIENEGDVVMIDIEDINDEVVCVSDHSDNNINILSELNDMANVLDEVGVVDIEDAVVSKGDVVDIKTTVSLKSNNTQGSSLASTNTSNNSLVNYSSDEDNEDKGEHNDGSDSEYTDCTSETDSSKGSYEGSYEGSEGSEGSDGSETESSNEPETFAYINNFPIQMICLEKCNGTLDELFEKGEMNETIGSSILMQIIMSLCIFQKSFQFTHNDLHTNNIMYINTDIEFIHYIYEGNTYKVPTYGKLFKIIDFGRSIYKFEDKVYCSDSFAFNGDAATQYNFKPYFNDKKPLLEPNYSFDLCRLGCSIYDFIIDHEQVETQTDLDEFQKTIIRWCSDDKNKNILYMKNGDDRYPNFKLYKMIARTVNKHTPKSQLEFPYFSQFLVDNLYKEPLYKENTVNIDEIPEYNKTTGWK